MVSNFPPFFVKMAVWVLTICTMWLGPTASVLSDGLRTFGEPCGPSKPTPRPSKLATSTAPGLGPWAVCSTAAEPAGVVMTGGTIGVAAAGCCPSSASALSRSSSSSGGATRCADEPPVLVVDMGARGRVLKETRPAVTSVRTTPIPRVRFMSESLADEGVVSEHHTGGRRYQLITLIDGWVADERDRKRRGSRGSNWTGRGSRGSRGSRRRLVLPPGARWAHRDRQPGGARLVGRGRTRPTRAFGAAGRPARVTRRKQTRPSSP